MDLTIVYTPDGGSEQRWTFDVDNPAWDIGSQTEKLTNWPWLEFKDRLTKGSMIALSALIYVLRKRDEPKLRPDAVQVTWGEIELITDEPDDDTETDDSADETDPKAEA
jgi:hypothetical protein